MEAVFELPMRDGNSQLASLRFRSIVRFWTSYEGWKRHACWSGDGTWPCFWTSYEGWKPASRKNSISSIVSFWTSYEGWKLPFRLKTVLETRQFLNFLWGMETIQLRSAHPIRIRVFELPMRDGNRHLDYLKKTKNLVFELPMRDGNDENWQWYVYLDLCFWTSYEGWKLEVNRTPLVTIDSFWTSYEGWKLKRVFVFRELMLRFWTSYEGWKLNPPQQWAILCQRFWTSYEGWKQIWA